MSDPITRLNVALEGRYRIESELGEGGMATVYLADDLKHERKVALKVLKPELAAIVGAERFLAEIQVTANLQHPNILPLFDSGEADTFLFYVMPYVEGDTLKDRLAREGQLPVSDAVAIAKDIAEALQAAHEQGVIHRDIKPGNVLISRGKPLISDFGIALALSAAGAGERLTETGLSLGTPYYMSPEQATGDQAVGASTDTYALGCVLYEMLVGDPPYAGSTAQAVLGKIIAGKHISATEERPSVPANVDGAIRKALEKLPADRFTSAQEFAKALGDPHFRYGEAVEGVTTDSVPAIWKQLTVGMTALATVATLAFGWSLLRPEPPGPVTRLSVNIPEDQSFGLARGDLHLSNDGSLMVYRARNGDGLPQLFLRDFAQLRATPIPGTVNAGHPAISPDGLEVAFDQGGAIRVVSLQGGLPRTVHEDEATVSMVPGWSPDGTSIYYRHNPGGLYRVPAEGGQEEIVTEPNEADGESGHVFVNVLPGGQKILYQTFSAEPMIQAKNLETGEVKNITPGYYPRYVSTGSSTGYLLFLDEGTTLMAAPFDPERFELGQPQPMALNLARLPAAMGFFAVSETRLVYLTERAPTPVTPVWVARNGVFREVQPEWTELGSEIGSSLALSPSGTQLALSIPDLDGTFHLHVKTLDTGSSPRRLTSEGTTNYRPNWYRDGQELTFLSNREGRLELWTMPADFSGAATPVPVPGLDRSPNEGFFAPGDTLLVVQTGNVMTGIIYVIRPGVNNLPVELVDNDFVEHSLAISPGGHSIAYVSNATGRDEVYVRPFPDANTGLEQQVSTDGGTEPLWSRSGEELFYRNAANELVAVQVTGTAPFTPGRHDVLFSTVGYLPGDHYRQYDISPDDQEFVMLRMNGPAVPSELILVDNWFEELRQRMGSN